MVNPNSEIISVEDLPVGIEGTVDWLGSCMGQVCGVKWDNGSSLILMDRDQFEVLGTSD
jgi:hypothetical protein